MKKNYLLIILFLSISFNGFSQFELKGFGGINLSGLTSLGSESSQDLYLGYQFGASVLFGTTWYGEIGATWMTNKQELTKSFTGVGPITGVNSISGVKVPLLVGYRFFGRSENLLNLRLFVGASANFLTKVKFIDFESPSDLYNSVIWNGNAGVGLDIWFLFLDIGYEFGFSEVYSFDFSKMNDFYANIGFRIMFGNSSRGRSKK